MKYNYLDYEQAHEFVAKSDENVFWDGWDIVIFKPNRIAERRSNGMRHLGRWGNVHRVKVNDRGAWRVPARR